MRCMLGLTATATMVTAASVSQHLGIDDYQVATIRGSPVPPNLCLSVSRDEDKHQVNQPVLDCVVYNPFVNSYTADQDYCCF